MDTNSRFIIFNVALVAIVAGILYYLFVHLKKEKRISAELKERYDQALTDGDKALALSLGRAYYSRLRGGRLSIYDEQAITNDLSTIDTASPSKLP